MGGQTNIGSARYVLAILCQLQRFTSIKGIYNTLSPFVVATATDFLLLNIIGTFVSVPIVTLL